MVKSFLLRGLKAEFRVAQPVAEREEHIVLVVTVGTTGCHLVRLAHG